MGLRSWLKSKINEPTKRELGREIEELTEKLQTVGFLASKALGSNGWNMLQTVTSEWTSSDELFQGVSAVELEKIYCRMAVVYACTQALIAAAQQGRLVLKEKGKDGKEIDSHPVLDVLRDRPNVDMTYNDFFFRYLMNLLITGWSFTWEERDALNGDLLALWPVPTSWVTPVSDKTGNLTHFEILQTTRSNLKILPEDMLITFFPDPNHLDRACGPLEAALRDVQVDEERQSYIGEMLVNYRLPGMILSQSESWSAEQKAEIRQVLNDQSGRGKRGNPIFMEGESAKIDMQNPLADLDWPGLTALNETRICAVFGVPPIVIGLRSGLDHGTYSNFEQAEKAMFTRALPPLWTRVGDAWTRGLLLDEGEENLELTFDTTEIAQLQPNKNELSERIRNEWNDGVITLNEARETLGREPLKSEVGDVLRKPMGIMEVTVSGELAASSELMEDTTEEPTDETIDDEEREDGKDEENETEDTEEQDDDTED